jgi:hypothetical protein
MADKTDEPSSELAIARTNALQRLSSVGSRLRDAAAAASAAFAVGNMAEYYQAQAKWDQVFVEFMEATRELSSLIMATISSGTWL